MGGLVVTAVPAVRNRTSGDKLLAILARGDGSTDDRAAINAALADGGRVVGKPGANYAISAHLIIPSNTTLDMRGCTITLINGNQSSLIRNYAAINSRTVVLADGAITSGDTTLTSATAAFVAGDVGKAIRVYGAGVNGDWLDTTIASRTSSTEVELAAAASTTTTTAGICIGTRDTGITVLGGTWVRPGNTGTPPGDTTLHSLVFRRCDNLSVRDVRGQTTNGKYFVSLADTTSFDVSGVSGSLISDGVHLNGLCFYGTIERVIADTGDDLVALTANDYVAGYQHSADVNGPIGDICIADCVMTANIGPSTPQAVAVYGDRSQTHLTYGIRVLRCSEQATTSQRSVKVHDYVRDVSIEGCSGSVTLSGLDASTNAMTGIRMRDHHVRVSTGGLNLGLTISNITVHDVVLDGFVWHGSSTDTLECVYVSGSSSITQMVVRNVHHLTSKGRIVNISGSGTTVSHLILEGCRRDGADYTNGMAVSCSSSATLSRLSVSGCTFQKTLRAVNVDQSGGIDVHFVGSRIEGTNTVRMATGAMTVYTAGSMFGGAPVTATGGTIASRDTGFRCDVSLLANNAGDMAYNTNSGLGCGTGPVIANGSAWKHLYTGSTTT